MLAAVYHGPQDVRIETVPLPEIGPGELLLKVKDASICGTDLRIFHGNHRKYPQGTIRIPGHEVVGTIAKIDSGVKGFEVGQLVFAAPNMGCGHCRECVTGNNNRCEHYDAFGITLDGAFAEYLRVPMQAIVQGNIMPIVETVNPAVAALIEPFACVLRGQRAVSVHPGDVVLVIGAGPIGIMHTKLARLSGAGRVLVSEPIPQRLSQAIRLGADRAVDPTREDLAAIIAEESHGQGADVVIVAAPVHQAQEQSLQLAGIGGRINFFGGLPNDRPTIRFDSNLVHYKELTVTATTACSTGDCRQATEIINSGKIDLSDLITQRFPLSQALSAFASAEDRSSLKIVLEP
ncbi:MAG: zinc-dependent dehydrogenase [Anaerolineales bacterium]|jgi:L-iditol 2-dehydrogenase